MNPDPTDGSDRGSLPMALLITLVAMALSAAMVPVVVGQITSTRSVVSRTDQLQAAETGVDVAVGHLRAAVATASSTVGELKSLPPCTMSGNAAAGTGYRVTVVYYRLDTSGNSQPQNCPPAEVPTTARLSSTGGRVGNATAAAALSPGTPDTRTVEATYTFRTNDLSITGGSIRLAAPVADPLCMDGGTDPSPVAGTSVIMRPCLPGGGPAQRFVYNTFLNLKLVGSETSTAPAGMCLEVPARSGGPVAFQVCAGIYPRQQWGVNRFSNFVVTPVAGATGGETCLNLSSTNTLVVGGCGDGSTQQVFQLQTSVGAGMAGAATGQLVNFGQFNRCLDVTAAQVAAGYLVVFPCRQSGIGDIEWNQQWTLPALAAAATGPATGRIRTAGTNNPGVCLRSPGSTASNQYVTVLACPSTGILTDPSLLWTLYRDTGDYGTSYRIADGYGNCLTPTDLTVAVPDTHTDGTAKAKVAACDRTDLQKWNAPPTIIEPLSLTAITER